MERGFSLRSALLVFLYFTAYLFAEKPSVAIDLKESTPRARLGVANSAPRTTQRSNTSLRLRVEPIGHLTRAGKEILQAPLIVRTPINLEEDIPKVTWIPAPSRLIVDIPALRARGNPSIDFKNHPFIQRLRVGTHPAKTRLVFDLFGETMPDYEVTSSARKIVITMRGAAAIVPKTPFAAATINLATVSFSTVASSANSVISAVETSPAEIADFPTHPLALPLKVAAPKADSSNTLRGEVSALTPSFEPAPPLAPYSKLAPLTFIAPLLPQPNIENEIPSPSQDVAPAPQSIAVENRLLALDFTSIKSSDQSEQPVIRMEFEKRPLYRLTQYSATHGSAQTQRPQYQLIVEKSAVKDAHLLMPQFPAQDFAGVLALQPSIKADILELKVAMEPGYKLIAITDRNFVYLKPVLR
jgi:hypothetical protein